MKEVFNTVKDNARKNSAAAAEGLDSIVGMTTSVSEVSALITGLVTVSQETCAATTDINISTKLINEATTDISQSVENQVALAGQIQSRIANFKF